LGKPADKFKGESFKNNSILSVAGFAHLIHDGFTDCLFVLLPLWANTFGLAYTEIGALKMVMSSFLSIFQVPSGLLSEKYGERVILALGTVIAALGFFLLWFVSGFFGLAGCLAIIGLGASTQHPLGSSLVSRVFSKNKRGALGVYNFSGDLGKVIFPFSIAAISAGYGWHVGTFFISAIGVVAGTGIYVALRFLEVGGPIGILSSGNSVKRKDWAITNSTGFFCLSGISMIDTSVRLSFLTYLPFLLIEKGAEVGDVGFALTLVFAGGAAGKLICGFIAERFGIIKTMIFTEVATGLGILALIFLPLQLALISLPFLGIALNGTSSVLYGSVGDFVNERSQARAFGLFYTLAIGAGALSPLLYGLISDQWGLEVCFSSMASSLILLGPLFFPLSSRLVNP